MNSRRVGKIALWIATGAGVLMVALLLISIAVVNTAWFQNYVREKIVSLTEESTGGRVEIGSFDFGLWGLHAHVTNFVVHGRESATEAPLFQAQTIDLRLKLLAGLKKFVDLEYAGIDHAGANVIVYPDGTTNVPEPKVVKKSGKSALETVVDLAIHKFEITNSVVAFAEQSIPLSLRGNDLRTQLFYHVIPASYQGQLHVGQLQIAQGKSEPLTATMDVPVMIGKDSIDVKNMRLATGESQIILDASVTKMNAPEIAAHAIAHLALHDAQKAAALSMEPCANHTPCFADADVELFLANGSLRNAKLMLTTGQTRLDASVNQNRKAAFKGRIATGELARLFKITGVLDEMAGVTGDAEIRGSQLTVNSTVDALGAGFASHAVYENSVLKVDGQLRGLQLREIERMFLSQRAAQQGYSGIASGRVNGVVNLKAKGTTGVNARADLRIAPDRGAAPIRGEVHGAYNGATDTIALEKSGVTLAHSRLDIAGVLGRRVDVTLTSTDTNDFLPAMAMTMANPPAKMPAGVDGSAGGRLELSAQLNGPIANPQITGSVNATRFVVEDRTFDRLSANFDAWRAGVTIRDGALARQALLAKFSGSVGMKDWAVSDASALQVAADLQNGDISDVLALAGYGNIPAEGAIAATAQIHGTIANPLGSVQVRAQNGSVYEQLFDTATLQADLLDGAIKLNALNVTWKSARVDASGTYTHARNSLLNGNTSVQVTSSGLDLAMIEALTKQHPGISGTVDANATASAVIHNANGTTQATISSLNADVRGNGLKDPKQTYGNMTAHVDTAGRGVNLRVDSNLIGAAIHIAGSTTLPTADVMKLSTAELKDFVVNADVAIQNASIESALALLGQDLPLRGQFALTARVHGNLAEPLGTAQIAVANASIYGESVTSARADVTLAEQRVDLQSLTATSAAGSIRANGTFQHPRGLFDRGEIQLHADTAGMRLANVKAIRDMNNGIDGTVKLTVDAAGELAADREVAVKKLDSSLAANGILYNHQPFGDATLTTQTRSSAVAIEMSSNFAGATIKGTGEAKLTPDLPLTANVTLSNLRYSNLRGFLGSGSTIRQDFEALLEARASVNAPLMKPASLNAKLEVTRLELTTKAAGATATSIALKNDGPIAAEYSASTLRIQKAHITGRSTDINIRGSAQFGGASPLNLAIKANTDLNLLEQIDRTIHASGAIVVDTTVVGAVSQPVFGGSIELKNANLNLDSIPNGLTNANGTVSLGGETARITQFTAETGGGKLTLTGFAARNGSNFRYTLRANAAHVRTRYQGMSVVNSANLTIGGTKDRSAINGSVTVERVSFNPQSDVGSMLAELAHGSGPKSTGVSDETVASTIRLDIRVQTAPDARFQTTFAQSIDAQADVTVTGTVEQPGLVGRVTISEGDIMFFGNQYLVSRGVISFYNPAEIDPQLNISLQTAVRNINVTLTVTGPMDNLKLSYVSDPPLPFDEIVGLLATGKRPSSDPAIVQSQVAAPSQSMTEVGASAIVNQAVATPLASRLQRVFGVSQLRIDPTFAGGSALPTARLSLQQRVSNSVTFTYSQDLSQSNSELIRVEWALSPRFSAVATRDENGIFGVDFFYKRQFR